MKKRLEEKSKQSRDPVDYVKHIDKRISVFNE